MKIPSKAKSAFQGNMDAKSRVELPFFAPSFFVVNGDARMEQLGGIHYFGGLACSVEKINTAAESWENRPLPIPGLQQTDTIVNKKDKLAVYASRHLFISPVGMRQFSNMEIDGKKRRVAPYTKGATPGIQVLSMLGYRDENKIIQPWAPIMVSASGYQVNHIQDSLASWNKAIKPFAQKLLPDVNPTEINGVLNLFWMSIGTFGTKQITRTVGPADRPDKQQVITPISAYIPENLDEKVLESLYVGDMVAEWMADLSQVSQEWLQVFKNMAKDKLTSEGSEPVNFEQPEPPPPEDDSIPF